MLRGLGEHGLLCIPGQDIGPRHLMDFSSRFGDLHWSSVNAHSVPGVPQVTVLSNIHVDGKPIGIQDAGQQWHTDMSYNKTLGFVNTLLARKVPMRDGKPLGTTMFANTQAAYSDLPEEVKSRLASATCIHSLAMYWDYMRNVKGSKRAAMTDEQKRRHPPVSHPVFLTHPISGNKLIYVNPSFSQCIEGMSEEESASTLAMLYEHVLLPKYRYKHEWRVGDLLVCDLIGTWHNAVPDYRPDEPRLLERCQVIGNRILDPQFVSAALAAAPSQARVAGSAQRAN